MSAPGHSSTRRVLAALCIACAPAWVTAAAPTVYRCGPDGRSFQSQPCADGQVHALRDDTPHDAARQEAQDEHRRMQAVGRELEAERRARERLETPRGAAGIVQQPLAEWQRADASARGGRADEGDSPRRGKSGRATKRTKRQVSAVEDRDTFTAVDPLAPRPARRR